MTARTLHDKLWDEHLVRQEPDGTALLYVDRHLVHEVSSPQAYDGLRDAGRAVWRPQSILATADHNTPTTQRGPGLAWIADPISRAQIARLDQNIRAFGAGAYFPLSSPEHGIVHVVGPEKGATHPGMAVACGDSHTSTHGAFGALALAIGTTEVEHLLATQTIVTRKAGSLLVRLSGTLSPEVGAKDVALALIRRLGGAAAGHVIEFAGPVVAAMDMEARMTLCNMAIETGARTALVGVDECTLAYLRGRDMAPGPAHLAEAERHWRQWRSDPGAAFDAVVELDAGGLAPQVTWGTTPAMTVGVDGCVPRPADEPDPKRLRAMEGALAYMGLAPGTRMEDIAVDRVFIGSCTNSRISDLRAAAEVVRRSGRGRGASVRQVLVVPGSGAVKRQAEAEGLDRVFRDAGFEWREPGCSMCVGMNADQLQAGERCASTSNRNFEHRQGFGGRTHLVSPAMAAASALFGRFVDLRKLGEGARP